MEPDGINEMLFVRAAAAAKPDETQLRLGSISIVNLLVSRLLLEFV